MVKQLCDHYKLHHIKIQDVIDEAVEKLVSDQPLLVISVELLTALSP